VLQGVYKEDVTTPPRPSTTRQNLIKDSNVGTRTGEENGILSRRSINRTTTDDNEITGHTNLGLLLEGTAPPGLTVTDNSDDAGFFAPTSRLSTSTEHDHTADDNAVTLVTGTGIDVNENTISNPATTSRVPATRSWSRVASRV
jgi:hypothetical protein